jgi:hypothetical protein
MGKQQTVKLSELLCGVCGRELKVKKCWIDEGHALVNYNPCGEHPKAALKYVWKVVEENSPGSC